MVTIVPFGKRGEIRLRPPVESPIRVTTATALARKPAYLSGTRREDTPTEAEAKSVVLAQPHRRGSADDLDGTALGRFCKVHWANDECTMIWRYAAGSKYAAIVDMDRGAQGLSVRKCVSEPGSSPISEADRQAYIDRCRIKRVNAEGVLAGVASNRRAVNVIYALAYDDRELTGRDHGVAINALYRLAVHFGFEKPTFHQS